MKPRPPAVAVTAEPWRRWVGYGPDGARRMIANVEEACRISTYGDSFTHGDRVNDGETWQEQVAPRLGEPLNNFGVGAARSIKPIFGCAATRRYTARGTSPSTCRTMTTVAASTR
jgi:hypothetical protein